MAVRASNKPPARFAEIIPLREAPACQESYDQSEQGQYIRSEGSFEQHGGYGNGKQGIEPYIHKLGIVVFTIAK